MNHFTADQARILTIENEPDINEEDFEKVMHGAYDLIRQACRGQITFVYEAEINARCHAIAWNCDFQFTKGMQRRMKQQLINNGYYWHGLVPSFYYYTWFPTK